MDRCKIFARISQREIISTKFCHLSIKYRKSECGYSLSGEDAFAVRKSEVGQLSITMFFVKRSYRVPFLALLTFKRRARNQTAKTKTREF